MADELIDGAPEGAAEVTDLRSTIRAAVDAQREPEAPEQVVEAVEPEKVAKPEKADAPETEAERNERLRDDKGKFATEKNAIKPEPKLEVAKADGEAPKPEADEKPALRPPPGWSPTAKVAFDKLPPEVQQAVANREEEVNKGFAKFQEYKPIDRYMEMAKQSGTTLDKALESYIGIENDLRRDFPGGITKLCQNQGIHPVALAQQILARYGSPAQPGETGDQPQARQQAGADPAVLQQLTALEQRLQRQEAEREREISTQVQTELERFASDPKHQFYENVKADMGFLIQSGKAADLEDAYTKACRMNPEIYDLLIKQQSPIVPSANAADAVQKAKAAAKATGGAPSAGFVPNPGTAGASIRDTIRAAVNSQRGI